MKIKRYKNVMIGKHRYKYLVSDYNKGSFEVKAWLENNLSSTDYSVGWGYVVWFKNKRDIVKFKLFL